MSEPSRNEPVFLWSFEEAKEKINEFLQKLDKFRSEELKIQHDEVLVLEPHERSALERMNNLIALLAYSETGEEKTVMISAIHELKCLFDIMGEEQCTVCGVNYHPVEVYAKYECPIKNCKVPVLKNNPPFQTLAEAESWFNQYGKQICPVHGVEMKQKTQVIIRQYFAYPKAFILLDASCECGFEDKTHYPLDPMYEQDIEEFKKQKCPICGKTMKVKEKKVGIKEDEARGIQKITEQIRFEYDLPYPRKGKLIETPPFEISGVKQRSYYDFYELEEPYVTGKIIVGWDLKHYLEELLNLYEVFIYEKETRASILNRLMQVCKALEENIIRDRTRILKPPDVAEVDGEELKDLVALGGEICGMSDIITRCYIRDYMQEHGHTSLLPLRRFKKALNYLKQQIERGQIVIDGGKPKLYVQVNVEEMQEILYTMSLDLPQLRGLISAIQGFVADSAVITKREMELLRQEMKARRELAISPLKGVRAAPLRERIMAFLLSNPTAQFTVDEIADALGEDKNRVSMALAQLAEHRRIKRVDKGTYTALGVY